MSEHVNSKWVGDMVAMHTKFGVNPVVREFDQTKARAFLEFRIKFLQEELDEMQKALDDFDAGNIDAITPIGIKFLYIIPIYNSFYIFMYINLI